MIRRKLEKYICTAIAIPVIAATMAACSSTKTPSETTSGTTEGTTKETEATVKEPVTLTYLSNWNGGGGGFPQDQENNPVAKRIREKIGVTLKMESLTTSEVEKLNTMFASDSVPDIVNAPFWSTTGGEGQVIKKAGAEGQLLDLAPYLDKYPNVKKLMTTGVSKAFTEFDLNHPDFQGKTYLIPTETPDGTPESITNWSYGLFARGDILKALNIKPEEVNTQDKLIDLLKKIKDGGFKDISGKPVIPAGTMHNGWSYNEYLAGWTDYTLSDFRKGEDGKLSFWMFSKDEEEKLMFMRKLIKEGLFDPEAFSNTDTMAKEKLATGKVAMFGAQPMLGDLQRSLYKTNPEMQYELLGPMLNKSGKIKTQVSSVGRGGFPVLFLSAKTKYPEKALEYIDYVNSDEGRLLAHWGIEGEHYTMENGQPKWNPEFKKQFDENPDVKRDAGLNFIPGRLIGGFSNNVTWPPAEEDKTQWDKLADSFKAKLPVIVDDRISANYLTREWPKYQQYQEVVSSLNYGTEFQKACFAESDEAALKILHDIQDKFRAAGAEEMTKFVEEKAASRTDIGF